MAAAHSEHLALTFQDMACFPVFMAILQQGFGVELPPYATIRDFLGQYCPKDDTDTLSRIQTVFLNGMPVDDMDSAILQSGDSLALSAAMPGLVGATLRAGGLLAGLRHSITFRRPPEQQGQGRGLVRIKLFNLLIKELGPAFLSSGILIKHHEMQQVILDLIPSCRQEDVRAALNNAPLSLDHLSAMDWSAPGDLIRLTVRIAGNPKRRLAEPVAGTV